MTPVEEARDLTDRRKAMWVHRYGRDGSFDDEFERMDSERSSRAAWWPLILLGKRWAELNT